jgi:hypothetical protein
MIDDDDDDDDDMCSLYGPACSLPATNQEKLLTATCSGCFLAAGHGSVVQQRQQQMLVQRLSLL